MADVWECSIDLSGIAETIDSTYGGTFTIWFHCISQPAADPLPRYNDSPDTGHYACRIILINNPSGVGASSGAYFSMGMQANTSPASEIKPAYWGTIYTNPIQGAFPNADFTANQTLTITKDTGAGTVFMSCGFASDTLSLSSFDSIVGSNYNNLDALIPQGFGCEFHTDAPGTDPKAGSGDCKFANIVLKKNGVVQSGYPYPLSAATPGTFYPDTGLAFETGVGEVTRTTPYWTLTQDTSDQHISFAVTTATQLDLDTWDYWRCLATPMSSQVIDLTRSPEHGMVFGALVYQSDPSTIKLRKTTDSGITWTETTVYTDMSHAVSNPTVAWSASGLVVVYQQGASTLMQSISIDGGNNWSAPVSLSITGTNPRLLIDPWHGLQFYFWVDSGGNLLLRRTGNYGVDWIDSSPITVATGLVAQTVAAQFGGDGTLIVGYINAGAWSQKSSIDFGQTWA